MTKGTLLLLPFLLAGCAAADSTEPPPATDDQELREQIARFDLGAFKVFTSSYTNLVLAGTTTSGSPFALVAGRHSRDFPYAGDGGWDNILLMVDGAGYAITAQNLPSFVLDADLSAAAGAAHIAYKGPMRRADGTDVTVDLDLHESTMRFEALDLGRPYDFLHLDVTVGMSWRPYHLSGARAGDHVTVGQTTHGLRTSGGELEHGVTKNFRAKEFAISYDYVALASPYSPDAYVRFVSHPLIRDGVLGRVLDWYTTTFASAELTLYRGALKEGNTHGVALPRADDAEIIAHDVVHLTLADLDRQLVKSADASGHAVYGLREIFTRK